MKLVSKTKNISSLSFSFIHITFSFHFISVFEPKNSFSFLRFYLRPFQTYEMELFVKRNNG